MARSVRSAASRRALAAALAALALGVPTSAYPISLAHLLQLPLEQLLRLEFSAPASVGGVTHGR
jgi:hypothetical protein